MQFNRPPPSQLGCVCLSLCVVHAPGSPFRTGPAGRSSGQCVCVCPCVWCTQRDREWQPCLTVGPACWTMGTDNLKLCTIGKKLFCTGPTGSADQFCILPLPIKIHRLKREIYAVNLFVSDKIYLEAKRTSLH